MNCIMYLNFMDENIRQFCRTISKNDYVIAINNFKIDKSVSIENGTFAHFVKNVEDLINMLAAIQDTEKEVPNSMWSTVAQLARGPLAPHRVREQIEIYNFIISQPILLKSFITMQINLLGTTSRRNNEIIDDIDKLFVDAFPLDKSNCNFEYICRITSSMNTICEQYPKVENFKTDSSYFSDPISLIYLEKLTKIVNAVNENMKKKLRGMGYGEVVIGPISSYSELFRVIDQLIATYKK